jgi:autotransporter-associated beta strand protein
LEGSVLNSSVATEAVINFYDAATADNASFTLKGGGKDAQTAGGRVVFTSDSSAANATFVCLDGGDPDFGGAPAYVGFYANAGAGHATITAEGSAVGDFGGRVIFDERSHAENATLIARGVPGMSGGSISFAHSATGDDAVVKVYGSGSFQFKGVVSPSLSIGSLEGDGLVLLGTKALVVGHNDLNTNFRGVISQSGSLTKIGAGTLTLASANTYSGGTFVEDGGLLTANRASSATGTGPVQVNHGRFGGRGIVAGAVTIGDGSGSGAILAPGVRGGTSVLTIQSSLTFRQGSEYDRHVNATSLKGDETIAQDITIEPSVLFAIRGLRDDSLPIGTVFTPIDNTAATPISGTFSNLPDGSSITIGSTTFQVSYEGGDGNDLTLTVVP